MSSEEITIVVNGEPLTVPAGSRAIDVVERLGLAGRPLALEVNAIVVPRGDLGTRQLAGGDRLEIVTLVGGG